jgi:hypothetical protein
MAKHGTIRAKYLVYVRFLTKSIIFWNWGACASRNLQSLGSST